MSESDTPAAWSRTEVDEIPEEYPDDVEVEDGPFQWRNDNTERKIWLKPNELENDEFDEWLVTGENSVVTSAESIEEAQAAARRFMSENTHPSAMI
jgi:hypothetical protein